jgi:Zn-dependent alcohol dehydrogenase
LAIDVNDKKLEVAKKFGADHIVNAAKSQQKQNITRDDVLQARVEY